MRKSSESVFACQTRMSEPPQVAKSSLHSRGKATSLIWSVCEVTLSSAVRVAYSTRYMLLCVVPAKKNSPIESSASEETPPITLPRSLGSRFSPLQGMTASSPSPEPTSSSSARSLSVSTLMPCRKRLRGPETESRFEAVSTLTRSPEVVPQKMKRSQGERTMHATERLSLPRLHSVGRTLRLMQSKSQTRSCATPPVTSVRSPASSPFSQVSAVAASCEAGLPQMAMPSSTFQMTRLLSSSLPMEARYVP